MAKRQTKSGPSLKDDITSIRTDPTFHDVTIVAADGVEVGASSTVLASRSAVFKAMLYGAMQESALRRITLREINSVALHAVLLFIYTDDIKLTISTTVEVYHAAHFFLLPSLMELVLEQVNGNKDLEVAVPLLNEALLILPWSDDTKDLYEALLKPFRIQFIAAGNLNELSDEAFELLLTQTTVKKFNTNEYDLLLCIVEWVWARTENAPPAIERYAIFESINDLEEEPNTNTKIFLGRGPSRVSLLKMMRHVDLTLVCPHRLKSLTEAIDVFVDELPHTAAFCYHACKNTTCTPEHLSEFRGEAKVKPRRRKLKSLKKTAKGVSGNFKGLRQLPDIDEELRTVKYRRIQQDSDEEDSDCELHQNYWIL